MTIKSLVELSPPVSLVATLALAMITASAVVASPLVVTTNSSPVTFAQFTQANGATQQWAVSTSGTTTTVTASGSEEFTFSGVPGVPFIGPELANFTLHATSTQIGSCGISCGPGDSLDQFGYSGTFSFIDAGSHPGAVLLAGTFAVTGSPSTTGAQFNSNIGSSSGGFAASATAGNLNQLVLTSAFMNFSGQTQEVAAFSLSSLSPDFAVGTVTGNQAYPSAGPFDAAGTGTFSSNPGPTATPEPATLSLFGGGLIALGFIGRKKLLHP